MSTRLNAEQQAAVRHPINQPLKVIAGAGTGKTTILVGRYVHLLEQGIPAGRLLALTFTNKAAGEMLERLSRTVPGFDAGAAWVMTFHAFALRLLKAEALHAGIDPRFRVIAQTDARVAYERACRAFLSGRLKNAFFDPERLKRLRLDRQSLLDDVYALIMQLKDAAVTPDEFVTTCNAALPVCHRTMVDALHQLPAKATRSLDKLLERAVYERDYEQELVGAVYTLYLRYQHELARRRALDFGDLVQRACDVLDRCPERRRYYQDLFCHILVDEFQDTSEAQFKMIRLLAADDRLSNVTVVGDDKQSIYGWRNARVENVRDFDAENWGGRSLTVNRNYRSFGEILELACHSIGLSPYFSQRLSDIGLLPEQKGYRGEPAIFVYRGEPSGEAAFIARQVRLLLETGRSPDEIVLLMRSLRGAKPYEDALQSEGVPYHTVGGMGFYDRQEVKDLLSLLRVIDDPLDSVAMLRLLTRPPFGLSDRFLSELSGLGFTCDPEMPVELYDRLERVHQLPDFEGRAGGMERVGRLMDVLAELRTMRASASPSELIMHALGLPDYQAWLDGRSVRERRRCEANLQKLSGLAADFTRRSPSATLHDFLLDVDVALRYDLIESEGTSSPGSTVRLMTIHQSKGLEFPVVFVLRIGPGRFPTRFYRPGLSYDPQLGLVVSRINGEHSLKGSPFSYDKYPEAYEGRVRCPENEARLTQQEEERRLWYVALTRAQDMLFLSGPPAIEPVEGGKRKTPVTDYLTEAEELLQTRPEWGAVVAGPVGFLEPMGGLPATVEAAAVAERLMARVAVRSKRARTGLARLVDLSFSTLRVFWHCPERYYFLNRWGFPQVSPVSLSDKLGYHPAILGTAVHRALERGHEAGTGEMERYQKAFDAACRDQGIPPEVAAKVYFPMVSEWLKAYASGPLGAITPGERWEQAFTLDVPAAGTVIRLRGFIDHLRPRSDGGWDVIDYKTNRHIGAEELADYRLQLQLYALACRNVLDIRPDSLSLYHLPTASLTPVPKDEPELKKALLLLIKSGEAIAAGEIPHPEMAGRGCSHCPVSICPKRQDEWASPAEENWPEEDYSLPDPDPER